MKGIIEPSWFFDGERIDGEGALHSVRFLKEAEKRGFRICDTEGIGHIMNPGVSEKVILKTFVNFFAMANADRIYSILNVEGIPQNSLYKTQYPRYAAIVGGKPFIRI